MPKRPEHKTARLVVQLTPTEKELLEEIRVRTGVPISEFVRRAIAKAIQESK